MIAKDPGNTTHDCKSTTRDLLIGLSYCPFCWSVRRELWWELRHWLRLLTWEGRQELREAWRAERSIGRQRVWKGWRMGWQWERVV